MKTILAGIGLAVVVIVLLLFAVCNDDDNDADSFGRIQIVASHQYDDGGGECWDEYDCQGRGGRYDYDYGAHDRHRNERRNRGAFSPGPFDRSPVTIIVCPPGTQYCGSDGGSGGEPPAEGGEA